MAIDYFVVHPTCDLHLLSTGVLVPMQLTILAYSPETNITSHPNTRYEGFNAKIVEVDKGKFIPKGGAEGETIGRIIHTDDAGNTHEVLVRVRVHETISNFWIGNSKPTIWAGESNYVLSVFAKFSDGTLGDITSHPYLTFDSSTSAAATVDGEGRLTGVSAGMRTQITVSHRGVAHQVNVHVRDPLTNDRPILKRIWGEGVFTERRNILILAEGLPTGEEAKFDEWALMITERLLTSPAHSPFNLLADSINVWTAFEDSEGRGVTVGPPVTEDGLPIPFTSRKEGDDYSVGELVELVGLPEPDSPKILSTAQNVWPLEHPGFDATKLQQATFDKWKKQVIQTYLNPKDSFFGLMLGGRLGDGKSHTIDPSLTPQWYQWYHPPAPHRSVLWDRRRMNKEWDFTPVLEKYLKSLKFGENPADPNYNVGQTWTAENPDQGLVCFMVYDEYEAGTRNDIFFALSIGVKENYTAVFDPPTIGSSGDHFPIVEDFNIEKVTSVFSHELGHALGLGDEYEGYDDPIGHATLPSNLDDPDANQVISNWGNLMPLSKVTRHDPNNPRFLAPSLIKWNWDRIQMASALAEAATNSGTDTIDVRLKSGEGRRWDWVKKKAYAVYLRNPELNPDREKSTARKLGPLTIQNINNELITLKGGQVALSDHFPKGSTLYLPKRDRRGNILTLIHRDVLAYFTTLDMVGFASKTGACKTETGPGFPDYHLPAPRNAYELIGIYEGGGTWNCHVFRPCGMCKMRERYYYERKWDQVWSWRHMSSLKKEPYRDYGFCFVCKYLIVNAIDPSQHDRLEKEYPGEND